MKSNSPVWETINEEDSIENGYTCYWGHIFTKDEYVLDNKRFLATIKLLERLKVT